MRKIILARVAGFCFGVQRAIDIALKARESNSGKITTLGPIVHNPQVGEKMLAEGIELAADLGEIRDGSVILSAHGVSPEVEDQARSQGLNIIDVTCPFVTRVHRTARQLVESGYQLLLLGEKEHKEVKGILGAIRSHSAGIPTYDVTVISGPDDLKTIKLSRKVGIITQTTQQASVFAAVVAEVCKTVFDVRAYNTICNATDELQAAALDLAKQVDIAFIVGGKNSANTSRLHAICLEQGIPAYQIETAPEIDESVLEGKERIGITAGASTPDWLIEEVAKKLNGGYLPNDFCIRHPDEQTKRKFFGNPQFGLNA